MYVAIAHVWSSVLGGAIGFARATNLLSATSTALAGAGTAWLFARRMGEVDGAWVGVLAALSAGTMMSVWSNATETEVYAVALLHAVAMLVAASLAGEAGVRRAYALLQSELQRDMQLLGITDLDQLSPDYLMRIGGVKAPGSPV